MEIQEERESAGFFFFKFEIRQFRFVVLNNYLNKKMQLNESKTFFLIVLFFLSFSFLDNKTLAFKNELIEKINNGNFGWKAELNPKFAQLSLDEAKQFTGFIHTSNWTRFLSSEKSAIAQDLPPSFDARVQWKNCIQPVRDQGQCGSCWAFASTEALGDRFCIATNGSTNVILSVQELVSCNLEGLESCRGGDPVTAYLYTSFYGLPSDNCYPYKSGDGSVPECRSNCVDAQQVWKVWQSDEYTLRWHIEVEGIEEAIYNNGPIAACFDVYSDFLNYKSGVYKYVAGNYIGGHCIKLVGKKKKKERENFSDSNQFF